MILKQLTDILLAANYTTTDIDKLFAVASNYIYQNRSKNLILLAADIVSKWG